MSVEQEIEDLLEVDPTPATQVEQALEELVDLLKSTDDSLLEVCRSMELASSKEALKKECKNFNRIIRLFTDAFPESAHDAQVLAAVTSLPMTGRWEAVLRSAESLNEASCTYKNALCKGLAGKLRRRCQSDRLDDEADEEMFANFLPVISRPQQPDDVES